MISAEMTLFAMMSASFWIGFASFAICVLLIVYTAIPRSSRVAGCIVLSWPSLSLRAALECLSLGLWLAAALPLLAWMFWIGDNDHWFYDYAWVVAAAVAALTSAVTVKRFRNGTATLRYARIHFWTPLVLLISFAAVCLDEFVQPIEATSADAAARRVLARISPFIDEPVRLVEQTGKLPDGLDPNRCKCYWIMGANEPRGRLSVCRYGWF